MSDLRDIETRSCPGIKRCANFQHIEVVMEREWWFEAQIKDLRLLGRWLSRTLIIEVGCGNATLAMKLWPRLSGRYIGIDRGLPHDMGARLAAAGDTLLRASRSADGGTPLLDLQRAPFHLWLRQNTRTWRAASSILLVQPPYPGSLGSEVAQCVQANQELVLIGYRPFHQSMVCGDPPMWDIICNEFEVLDMSEDPARGLGFYRLRRGDSHATRERILQGHDLWQLPGPISG